MSVDYKATFNQVSDLIKAGDFPINETLVKLEADLATVTKLDIKPAIDALQKLIDAEKAKERDPIESLIKEYFVSVNDLAGLKAAVRALAGTTTRAVTTNVVEDMKGFSDEAIALFKEQLEGYIYIPVSKLVGKDKPFQTPNSTDWVNGGSKAKTLTSEWGFEFLSTDDVDCPIVIEKPSKRFVKIDASVFLSKVEAELSGTAWESLVTPTEVEPTEEATPEATKTAKKGKAAEPIV